MRVIGRGGAAITTVDEWRDAAGPKDKAKQWRNYRSAKELARAWLSNTGQAAVPDELARLLASHPLTANGAFEGCEIRPELRVPIDDLAGEPRNTDLAFVYETAPTEDESLDWRRVAVSVEAKADESFGQRVSAAIRASEARRDAGKASHGDERARALLHAMFGEDAALDPSSLALRYQLLTATAGALSFAKGQKAEAAVLAVFEFAHAGKRHTSPRKLDANAHDLDAFVARLSGGRVTALVEGWLAGPFTVPGNQYCPNYLPLLIGKARRILP